jgi:hypothetical protein
LLADAMPLRLVGAMLLADSVWGVLWRLTASGREIHSGQSVESVNLPYYQAGSPLGRALRLLRHMIGGASGQEVIASVALAAVLGVLLGPPALLLSLIAWAVTLWAWLLAQSGRQPAGCDALLNVGLPWLLGLIMAQAPSPRFLTGAPLPLSGVTLGLAFTVLQLGARRAHLSQGQRVGGVWLGHLVVLGVLVGLQRPQTLILVALLFLPPLWWLWREMRAGADLREALSRSGPWWLAAFLASAISSVLR